MERQLVVFEIAKEHYGVDIAAVESIIKMQPITSLPHSPAFVEGVTNLRGAVLPVIDLRKRFGLTRGEESRENRIVVVALDGTKVGMVVDAVSEVLHVQDDAVEPPPPMVTSVDTAFITGIAKLGSAEGSQRLVILLDLGKVLSMDEKAGLKALPMAA
jgi:purine-binding chemotaxis protein CheW